MTADLGRDVTQSPSIEREPAPDRRVLLSIITAMYNAEATVKRTLDSVRLIPSEHRNVIEVLVVNDGSTDRGPEFVSDFADDNPDLHVILLNKENGGSASARNLGLGHARGEWVLLLDADDELCHDPLPYLRDAGDATVLGFSVQLFVHGRPHRRLRPTLITPRNHLEILTAGNPVYPLAVAFRRDAMREWFDEQLRTLEDWVFWMRNDTIFERMRLCSDITIGRVHIHGGNKSSRYVWRGGVREQIAEDALLRFAGRLTRRTRNNLLLQRCIGRLQQGRSAEWSALFRLPVDPVLYWKFWVYLVLRNWFGRFDLYGRAARQVVRR